MFGLGFTELIAILFIALIFVGPKKLPELAKSLGKGIRDFQNAAKGLGEKLEEDLQQEPQKLVEDHPDDTNISHESHESQNVVVVGPPEIKESSEAKTNELEENKPT